jgi:hypothetical protein
MIAAALAIRPAVPGDADGIAHTFLESAEYHAQLDSERYSIPAVETISARYREGRQHPSHTGKGVITLVAELNGDIVDACFGRLKTGGAGSAQCSPTWNIMLQTRALACSIRSAWAIGWHRSQP